MNIELMQEEKKLQRLEKPGDKHIVPTRDIIDHVLVSTCLCHPSMVDKYGDTEIWLHKKMSEMMN